MQTRKISFVESWVNVLVGFTINYCANLVILPLFGFHVALKTNFWLGVIYTFISLVRSYTIRRWFAGREVKTFS